MHIRLNFTVKLDGNIHRFSINGLHAEQVAGIVRVEHKNFKKDEKL